MMSSQHGSYTLGYTHPTMANNNELQTGDRKLISEISPQFRSESAIRLREAGIASIANQQVAVNTFSPLVHTARQGSKVGGTRMALQGQKVKPAMKLKS